MRLAAPFLFWLAVAAPAAAQTCEASIFGKIGEVTTTLTDKTPGAAATVAWAMEGREGVGVETENFSRPGLLVDFTMDGAKLSPTDVMVTISRISGEGRSRPPPLSQVRVQATPRGGTAAKWEAEKPAPGEAAILKQLQQKWPDELLVEAFIGDRIVASAIFDLTVLPAVREAATQAAADALKSCS